MLFSDDDGNRMPDASEEILRVDLEPTSRHLRVVSTIGRQQLRYLPDGRSAGTNLTVSICNMQGELLAHLVAFRRRQYLETGPGQVFIEQLADLLVVVDDQQLFAR